MSKKPTGYDIQLNEARKYKSYYEKLRDMYKDIGKAIEKIEISIDRSNQKKGARK